MIIIVTFSLQVDNQDLVSHCEKLETRLGQLDKIRQKQAKKISNMKEDIAVTENGGQERMGKAESAIQALSSELATTKHLLTDVGQREKQVSLEWWFSKCQGQGHRSVSNEFSLIADSWSI